MLPYGLGSSQDATQPGRYPAAISQKHKVPRALCKSAFLLQSKKG